MTTTQPQTPQEVPLPPAPSLPFTMKANFTEYRRRVGVVRIVIAAALIMLIWLRFGYLAGAISTVVIVATITITLSVLYRRSFTVSDTSLLLKTSFGRSKELAWANLGKVHIFAQYLDEGFGVMPRVIISDKNGNGFASFTSLYWSVDEMNLLLASLKKRDVEVEWYADVARSSAIKKTLPKLLPYYEQHPFIIAIGIVGLLLVAITVFVLLTR